MILSSCYQKGLLIGVFLMPFAKYWNIGIWSTPIAKMIDFIATNTH
jgi:hypothetical protein